MGFFPAFYNLNFTNYPCSTKIKVEKKGNTPPKSVLKFLVTQIHTPLELKKIFNSIELCGRGIFLKYSWKNISSYFVEAFVFL